MWDFEDLFWALSEFIDLTFYTHLLYRVLDLFYIDHAFISEWMEQVERFYCLLTSLSVSEDQVYPFVNIL